LQFVSKNELRNKISFICIDKRTRDAKNNQIYVILENGSKVIMPPNVHSVPALLLVKQNYHVIYGDEIMNYYKPHVEETTNAAQGYQGEPMAFSISPSNGTNIVSEQYTFYHMTPEELSSKGKGGARQMHNYVSAVTDTLFIQTPPDTYRPDKLSNSVTIDTIQSQRNQEVPQASLPSLDTLPGI
jgi:hypothetical protein